MHLIRRSAVEHQHAALIVWHGHALVLHRARGHVATGALILLGRSVGLRDTDGRQGRVGLICRRHGDREGCQRDARRNAQRCKRADSLHKTPFPCPVAQNANSYDAAWAASMDDVSEAIRPDSGKNPSLVFKAALIPYLKEKRVARNL